MTLPTKRQSADLADRRSGAWRGPHRHDPAAPCPSGGGNDAALTDDRRSGACALASCRERQAESLDQGRAFMLAAAPWGVPRTAGAHALSCRGRCGGGAQASRRTRRRHAYLQAFASQPDFGRRSPGAAWARPPGCACWRRWNPSILAIAAETKAATLDDLGGCAFRSDLAAMRHETQYTRLFRS